MAGLRILFIGSSLVLAGAIERARNRGHQIIGIFATVQSEADAMARAGLPVQGPTGSVAEFVAERPCDVLLSVINEHILNSQTLALPRLAAVNFHNAPLPAYAGLWATSWALLNGEREHGVTWHVMASGIDTGPILAQRHFPIAADDTTATLNRRCAEAALDSLDEVFGKLESGHVGGADQDPSRRSYYSRFDTAPNGGRIDWSWTAERILRLVRACDWGTWKNGFGRSQILAPDGVAYTARAARRVNGSGSAGTVLACQGRELTVATVDGALLFDLEEALILPVGCSLLAFEPQHSVPSQASGPDTDMCRDTVRVSAPEPPESDVQTLSTVIEQLARWASMEPQALAIAEAGTTLTHGELDLRSAALATMLIDSGVKAEDGVGLLLPAGIDFVVCALASMRAGAAYVPLDPASPRERLRVECVEAGITHLVTISGSGYAASDFQSVVFVCLDLLETPQCFHNVLPPVPADRSAYRIFTSGSSGKPKAVEIVHSALANLIEHYRVALPMTAADRMTMLAKPVFDASVADVWPVLAAGGTLLVPPPQLLIDPPALLQWLVTSRATCSFVPTAVAERLIGLKWPEHLALRTLLTGGDSLHSRPPPELNFKLINTYGPTENTVDSLWAEVKPFGGVPPIGLPIRGVSVAVVDAQRAPVAPGQLGELVLGGSQLARGYRGREDLTARQFGACAALNGQRGYYTGDLVRINEQGEFEFHGRIDNQVQVRGVRVEPGEVEALLKTDVRVLQAVCLPIRFGNEVTGMSAHILAAPGVPRDAALRDALHDLAARQLPAVLQPKIIEFPAELPYTAAGKIDRRALAQRIVVEASTEPAPAEGDDALRNAWMRVLPGASPASENQSFWELGGDSLAVMELLLELETCTGVRLPMGMFLADPTLAGLRREFALRRNPIITRLSQGKGPPLVLWHETSGDLGDYSQLIPHLADREVLGVISPALFDLESARGSLEETVAFALSSLKQFGVVDAPALLGYSWGGLLAYEAARQLAQQQTPAPFVGLIGTMPPKRELGRAAGLADLLQWKLIRGKVILTKALQDPALLLRRIRRSYKLPPRVMKIIDIHVSMSDAYSPSFEPHIGVFLIRERIGLKNNRRHREFVEPDFGWRRWTGVQPRLKWIDADHHELLKGHFAAELAAIVNDELEQLIPVRLGTAHRLPEGS